MCISVPESVSHFRSGFSACFSLPTPTSWSFPFPISLPHPVFSPAHTDLLPAWVFPLAFLYLHPRRGVSRSQSRFHAHFSLIHTLIRFQSGFFRLFSTSYTHVVGLPIIILLSTPICHRPKQKNSSQQAKSQFKSKKYFNTANIPHNISYYVK